MRHGTRAGLVTVGMASATAAGSFAIGHVTAGSRALGAVVIVGALVVVLCIRSPIFAAIFALLTVFNVQRLGGTSSAPGASGGVSYSDATLALASVIALPAVVRLRAPALRIPLIGVLCYQASLLPSLMLHQSSRVDLEWLHRLVLVGGALIVGAWIARGDTSRTALRALIVVSVVMGLFTIYSGASTGFTQPATPLGLNKNFIGALLCDVIVVVMLAGKTLDLRPRIRWISLAVLIAGALAAQSRGSFLAAGVALFVAALMGGHARSRASRLAAVLVAVGLGWVAYSSVHAQLTASQQDFKNGSLGVRYNVERVTLDIWRSSPATGVGMKYFNTGVYGPQAQVPNNVIDNELAESGVVGLAGFVAMMGCAVGTGVSRRRTSELAVLGTAVVLGSLAHGMVDIYWTAGVAALPFILLGMGLASDPARVAPTGVGHG